MSFNLLDTSQVSAYITCDCGEVFRASVYKIINASIDTGLVQQLFCRQLNQVHCSRCGRDFSADTPLYLHDPAKSKYLCLYPSAWRSRELDLRVAFYQELLASGHANIQSYVKDAKFVFGLEPAAEILRQLRQAKPAPFKPKEQPVHPLITAPPIQELEERDFEQILDVESVDLQDAALVQNWKESGQGYYTFWDEGSLHILQRHEDPDGFGDRGDLFFQLHRIENFPLIVLVLVVEAKSHPARVLHWIFNLDNKVDVRFLEQLASHFEVRLHLFDSTFHPRRLMIFGPALEKNVSYVLEQARSWMESIDPSRRNFFIAASKFDQTAYHRIGQQQQGLDPLAFRDLPFPSVTKLALEILTYWSSKQHYEYLIFIKSFSVKSFQTILQEVLKRAIHFGLSMSEKMKRACVELNLAKSKSELVALLLRNFYHLVKEGKDNDLDLQSQADNWKQLLEDAQETGCQVEAKIARLASTSQRSLEEWRRTIPLDLADDIEMLGALDQLKTSELLSLLKEKQHRAEAARVLAESKKEELLDDVTNVFGRFSAQEMDRFGDALGAFGESARPFVLQALAGKKTVQARGALRALARLDEGKAVVRLLEEIKTGRRGIWEEAVELTTRIGDISFESLGDMTRHPDPAVRGRIILLLSKLRGSQAQRLLLQVAQKDPSTRNRSMARKILEEQK